MVNHKWNVLNAMRFYNRINKDFSGETYGKFYLGKFNMSELLLEIRKHKKSGRVERVGANLVLTEKGHVDLRAWESVRRQEREEKLKQNALNRGFARPNSRNKNGSFAKREE
jgi:hypothetical protein